ncbi:MAG: tail assembly protein [Burkholderiaceae bacterium]|nr:tail assembly protein [Burkholderiaceae bacterium]
MLRTIRVYGQLAKFLGRKTFEASVRSAAEAVRFLLANFPELKAHMNDQYYKVIVGDYSLAINELHDPSGQQEIKIVPVIGGAGGEFGTIIAGLALVILSIAVPGLGLGLAGATVTQVGVFGAGLILTGIAGLLTPTPTLPTGIDTQGDPRKSYSFSGVQNTSRQGLPVPICYGEVLVGSVVISAGIDTVDISG